jgi:hypothetical protein
MESHRTKLSLSPKWPGNLRWRAGKWLAHKRKMKMKSKIKKRITSKSRSRSTR